VTQLLSSRKVSAMQMSDDFTPDGATITPIDDYAIWLRCAELTNTYGSLANVLADSTAMTTLMSSENAVNYMLRSITNTSGKILYEVVNSETAMEALDASFVALTGAFNTEEWLDAMLGSSTAVGVLDATAVKVPTMTSNTTPSGVVSASSLYGVFTEIIEYKVFNGEVGTGTGFWGPSSGSLAVGSWIQYKWASTYHAVYKIVIYPRDIEGNYIGQRLPTQFKLQGSNNGSSWTDIQTFTGITTTQQSTAFHDTYYVTNSDATNYMYYRYLCTGAPTDGTSGTYLNILELEFYGKELA
jgi:hypothetical protein